MSSEDQRWLEWAKQIAANSNDPSTKFGAVVVPVSDSIVAAHSCCNKFPVGIFEAPYRLSDRRTKLDYMLHAEVRACLRAGFDAKGATLYCWPGIPPCHECAKIIIEVGIVRVVGPRYVVPRWAESCELGEEMLREVGIAIDFIDMENPSDRPGPSQPADRGSSDRDALDRAAFAGAQRDA